VKRLVIVGLVIATAAVAYAAAGERFSLDGLLGRLSSGQSLPSLKGEELPFNYPVELWRDSIEGEVVLRIHITAAGAVDSVELEESSGHEMLDEIALRGAHELRYHPARDEDQPVDVWARLPVRFQRGSVTAEPERQD
jgi:TonB family protein